MSEFEIARIILFVSISISVLILAIQFARLIGEFIGIVKESKKTISKFDGFFENVEKDYQELRDKVFDIVNFLEIMVSTMTGVIGVSKIVNALQTWFNSKDKNSKTKENDN
ncbi:MAG: hypothetical protein KatS3mg085_236 [Candidatus Dojkabacteria bacterium]|nr:MAG: hypothetical protein KatS3mg085_236 [Candidatus Dojkabacteria bacterium]